MNNKIIIISFLSLFLIACSNNTNGIDKTLYNDSKELIQAFYEVAEDSDVIEMNETLDSKLDKYKAKYDMNSQEWDEIESELIYDVTDTYIPFIEYHLDKDVDDLEKFYKGVSKLEKDYDMKF